MNKQDQAIVDVLRGSTILAFLEGLGAQLLRSVRQSRSAAIAASVAGQWPSLTADGRRGAWGSALVIAAVVHIALVLAAGEYPNWFFFVIPATAAAVGALAWTWSAVTGHARR